MPAVQVITNVTAMPKPKDDLTSREIAKKEHMPRKFTRRMLFVKTAAKKMTGALKPVSIEAMMPCLLLV
jgi:hypothetical protein